MKTGNTTDGLYLFLLIVPIIISLWTSGIVRKKIESSLVLHGHCNISSCLGISGEILTIITGLITGILLLGLVS